jgi:hypothetical protein
MPTFEGTDNEMHNSQNAQFLDRCCRQQQCASTVTPPCVYIVYSTFLFAFLSLPMRFLVHMGTAARGQQQLGSIARCIEELRLLHLLPRRYHVGLSS